MKKKKFSFLITVFAIAVFSGNSIVLAETDYLTTTVLTREAVVVSKLKSVFSIKTPAKSVKTISKSIRFENDITLLLKEAAQNFDLYDAESQQYLSIFLMRPDSTLNNWPWDGEPDFYLPAPVSTYDSPNGEFKFWYVTHSTPDNSGVVHATTLSEVEAMAAVFEIVYAEEITTMGYPAPPDDSGSADNGGDARMDVYIMNTGAYSVYGYTASEGAGVSTPSFMVMDNDFEEFVTSSQTATEAMQVTAAHEYHHAVQFGINTAADAWIMEATSTWMEDQVFDNVDDNLQYLNASGGFFANPHESLDSTFHFYNSWIWMEYMEIKWGKDAVKSLWLDYLDSSNSGLTAVSGVLADEGSTVRQAFSEFARVNYDQEDFYPDYDSYNSVSFTNEDSGIGYNIDRSSDTSTSFETQTISLNHLAVKYVKLTPGASLNSEQESLTIVINGTDDRQIDLFPFVVNDDLSITEPQFSLDSANDGVLVIDNFSSSGINEVVLALVNYSEEEDNSSFEISGGLDSDGGGGGGGCFIDSLTR